MKRLISEEYRIREIQQEFARKLKPIMYDLGAGRAKWGDVGMWHYRKGNHWIVVSDHKNSGKRNGVLFENERYDTSNSKIEYGKTKIIKSGSVDIDEYSRTLDNRRGGNTKTFTVSEDIELSRETSYTFSQSYEFSIRSETEISGSYGGAEISQTLEATFGSSFGTESSESESKTVTRSISLDFDVDPGKAELVVFRKDKLITETPFKIKGYLDFGVFLDFENWARNPYFIWHRKGSKYYKWNSLLEFERFLKGYHVDYMGMKNWKPGYDSRKAMSWLFNRDNFKVEVEGVKYREIEDNLSVETTEAS